ncbi:MAG: hypothetical protein ABSE47_10930 [Acidimicrobiales bacterium]|jgi:hypothetical protein
MNRLARRRAFASVVASTVVVGALIVPLRAAAGAAKNTTKPIGYIYAGSIFAGLDTLAVAANDSVKVVKKTASPSGDIGGVALLHGASGLYLYVIAGPFAQEGEIYQYSVNKQTGAITRSSVAPVAGVLPYLHGNNLFAFDGRATNSSFASVIYANVCIDKACTKYGLQEFRANPTTGALSKVGTAGSEFMVSVSVSGERMAILQHPKSGPGLIIDSLLCNEKTGGLTPVGGSYHLVDKANDPIGGTNVAAGAGVGIDGVELDNIPSVGVETGSSIDGVRESYEGSALAFIPHALLDAEVGPTYAPWLQIVAPNGETDGGHIDLSKSPFDLGGGSNSDPNGPETIFQLGTGIYIGVYLDPIVQATDGVGGKGLVIDKQATVGGTISVDSMAGFLEPSATTTSIAVAHAGKNLDFSGKVKGGAAGISVSVTLYVKKGNTFSPVQQKSAKLTTSLQYSTSLSRPNASTCRAKAVYEGNGSTAVSSAVTTFSC